MPKNGIKLRQPGLPEFFAWEAMKVDMKYRIIACNVFKKDLLRILGDGHGHELVFLDFGFHRRPAKLRERLQALIRQRGDVGAILLLYGYCGGTMKLQATDIPVVMPKAHDCFDIMLGREERLALFQEEPGTYFLSEGWVRNDRTPAERIEDLKGGFAGDDEIIQAIYSGYHRILFVKTGAETEDCVARARRSAQEMTWSFEEKTGVLPFMNKMVSGTWDDDFVVLAKRR